MSLSVAPLAGAWIEIFCKNSCPVGNMSLPSRERGLKSPDDMWEKVRQSVAPLAGAWIEISYNNGYLSSFYRRSPRGSVD